jgi:TetR/AcrR family transcriptional repressor of uid operon
VTDVAPIGDPLLIDLAAIDDTSTRLVTAAAQVFAERGYDGAGVQEIARRAGLTTGAIYSRYRGKADLLVEAIDPHAHDELEALFSDHHFEGRMEDILLTAGTHLVKREGGGAAQASLLLEAFVAARRHPDVAEVLRARVLERQDRLTTIVETAKADGGIAPDIDTESLVAFCHALAFGFLLFDATDLPLPTPGPWEHLIAQLLAALGRSGAADAPPHAPDASSPTTATEVSRGN